MTSILAFDTSGPYCAAAIVTDGDITQHRHNVMARGQAEHLMGFLEEGLQLANLAWQDLSAIAVGVGPGNFTGIRISVSAARGLALGLNIPALGISTFEAWADPDVFSTVIISAPREMVYRQALEKGLPVDTADHIRSDAILPDNAPVANRIDVPTETGTEIAERIARVAWQRWIDGQRPAPKPLYVKHPDAAPARDAAPRILP